MAFCTNCSAELTGDYCTQCGAPSGDAPRGRQGSAKTVLKWVLISFGALFGVLVLAAIIVPLVVKFDATDGHDYFIVEWQSVQSSIDIMILDNNMTEVTTNGTAAKITSTTDFGGGQFVTE